MIDLERSVLRKIKRANTDWWINEKAIVGANGKTYIAYYTDMGEIHVKELDAKCSRALSRDVRLCTLNQNYADEHNAPSICVLESGKILAMYTGHGDNGYIKYRITERPYDIDSFGEEITLPYEGKVTYAQVFENTHLHQVWLFTRVNGSTWEFRYSEDEGKTFSKPRKYIGSQNGRLFYMNIRKMDVILRPHAPTERWFFAFYGHPISSEDHTIRSGFFDCEGYLLTTDGARTAFNLFKGTDVIDPESLDTVYVSPEGTTVRLLEVSSTMPPRIGFTPFVMDDMLCPSPDTIVYHCATFTDGNWKISEPICTGGEFLGRNIPDGSQTYVGGMAFYYGSAEAGLGWKECITTDTHRVYITRFDGKDRVVESYQSFDFGKTYNLEQVIRRIPGELDIKAWRPIVPIHAQDNMPVYWHEGRYVGHTGGWHSDIVTYIEYDD